jgi:EAL domain-containing protein (putative c-di-GMP-specific phosphodiesterase class I)
MSIETLREYIARLPAGPEPGRALHRLGPVRVAGSLGTLRISSVFQPIASREGALFGHQAFFRAEGPDGREVPVRQVLDSLADEEAVVRFDRMCRTVHALNRFAAAEQWTPLLLGVDARLLRYVPEEHGTTFQRILAGFGVLASRVLITLPAEAADVAGLLENVLPSYRLRNFGIAVDVDGWPAAYEPRLARLRPELVRVRWSEEARRWAPAAHDVGARLVATHVETAAEREAALRAGADFLQGGLIGVPSASLAGAVEAETGVGG